MIRELVTAAALCAAAVGAAAVAGAEPRHYDSDVPGMAYDVELDGMCTNWERFTFGRSPDGEAVACHYIPNQFPGTLARPKDTGFWVISYPLYGVQEVGSPCPGPQSSAQSPDGLPLLCFGEERGWQPGVFTGGAGPYAPPGIQPVG